MLYIYVYTIYVYTIYIYIYDIRMHTYTYIHIHIHIYIYIYTYTYTYTCIYTHATRSTYIICVYICTSHYISSSFPVFIDETLTFRHLLRRAVWRASVRPMEHLGTSDGSLGEVYFCFLQEKWENWDLKMEQTHWDIYICIISGKQICTHITYVMGYLICICIYIYMLMETKKGKHWDWRWFAVPAKKT